MIRYMLKLCVYIYTHIFIYLYMHMCNSLFPLSYPKPESRPHAKTQKRSSCRTHLPGKTSTKGPESTGLMLKRQVLSRTRTKSPSWKARQCRDRGRTLNWVSHPLPMQMVRTQVLLMMRTMMMMMIRLALSAPRTRAWDQRLNRHWRTGVHPL